MADSKLRRLESGVRCPWCYVFAYGTEIRSTDLLRCQLGRKTLLNDSLLLTPSVQYHDLFHVFSEAFRTGRTTSTPSPNLEGKGARSLPEAEGYSRRQDVPPKVESTVEAQGKNYSILSVLP